MSSSENNQELESFREQWRAEVRARHPGQASRPQSQPQSAFAQPSAGPSTIIATPGRMVEPPQRIGNEKKPVLNERDEEYFQSRTFDEDAPAASTLKPTEATDATAAQEPVTALEHYEKAVEKEAIGSLGESLRLYRKAFRMDDSVDQKYRIKHFPKKWDPKHAQPGQASSSTSAPALSPVPAAPGDPATARKTDSSVDGPKPMNELIASFSGLMIEPAKPEIEGMPQPPCPISELPGEILVHILRDVAIHDVADFVRLARVCKRFAFLVATEDRIWRRICLGPEFGFEGMHYLWQRQVTWQPLDAEEAAEGGAPEEAANEDSLVNTLAFFSSRYNSSWQRMFRLRPRIRFGGCYISTVNYIRPGQVGYQLRWDTPVLIVTYYRYLRFFRDGTVISLLTTTEPADVVHHMTREVLDQHKGGAMGHLPSIVMKDGLRGRWRLANSRDNPEAIISELERNVIVETVGVGKYNYRLDLAMHSAGKAARNNKLSWRGFYSYNRLTDDWAEFGLKNDKPFFFSRVKSYGTGS